MTQDENFTNSLLMTKNMNKNDAHLTSYLDLNRTVLNPEAIRIYAIGLLLLDAFLLISYSHVIACMARAKLYYQPFFLQLLILGGNDILLMLLYAFYLVASAFSLGPKEFSPNTARTLDKVQTFLQTGVLWMYLMIAIARAAAVFYPIKSRTWFRMRNVLVMVLTSFIYAFVAVFVMLPGVYIPKLLTWMPRVPTPGEKLPRDPPFGSVTQAIKMGLRAFPVFLSVIIYVVTICKLYKYQKMRLRQRKALPAHESVTIASHAQLSQVSSPTTVKYNMCSIPENASRSFRARHRAQWNMIKLAVCLLILFIFVDALKPVIATYQHKHVALSGLQMLAEILLAGLNPYLYCLTCAEVRRCVKYPQVLRRCFRCSKRKKALAEVLPKHANGQYLEVNSRIPPLITMDTSVNDFVLIPFSMSSDSIRMIDESVTST